MAISKDQASAIKSAFASAASSGGSGNAVQNLAGDIYQQHTGTENQSTNPTTTQGSTAASTGVNRVMENQAAAHGVVRSDAQGWNNGRIDSRTTTKTMGADSTSGTGSAATTVAATTAATAASGGSTPYQTTYRDSRGNTYTGYIINGKTYTDPQGKTEVPVGSLVTDSSGNVWRKGYGNNNEMVSSPNADYHYDYMEGVNASKELTFTNPDTGKTNYIAANPVQGKYIIYDSQHNSLGYIDSAGVYHSATPDSSYDVNTANAARKMLTSSGYNLNGDGIVKIANGQDLDIERSFLINQYSDELAAGRDGADILAKMGLMYDANGKVVANPNGAQTGGTASAANAQSSAQNANIVRMLTDYQNQNSQYQQQQNAEMSRVANELQQQMNALAAAQQEAADAAARADAQRQAEAEARAAQYQQRINDLKPLLDAWQEAALAQQQSKIDYATQKGINDLERAQEDAQVQFKAAQEQIAADELAARDNQALYAEARGDKGGIGAAQYDNIANTAAINRQSVRDAQTKLATDTWRQIADLRAQGEYEKADAVLEITQTYLSNLISLEQWAANYGLSAAQFEESVREWEKNFQLSVAELTGTYKGAQTLAAKNADRTFALNEAGLTGYYNGRPTLAKTNADREFALSEAGVTGYYNGQPTLASKNADKNYALSEAGITGYYNGNPTYTREKNDQSTLASAGSALLNAGIMPSADQLAAMGLSETDAQSLLMAYQLSNAVTGSRGSGGGGSSASVPIQEGEDFNAILNSFFELASKNGGEGYITSTHLKGTRLAGYDTSWLKDEYRNWVKKNTPANANEVSKDAKALLGYLTDRTGVNAIRPSDQWKFIQDAATGDFGNYDLSENDVRWLYEQIGYGDYQNNSTGGFNLAGAVWDPKAGKFVTVSN